MKFLTGIWSIVKSLPVKTQTIFVFAVLIIAGGYFFLDRILNYQETIAKSVPQKEKRIFEREKSDLPDYVSYDQKTLFGNTAEASK